MAYEIKLNNVKRDGRNINKSYIATACEMTTKDGDIAIKFLQTGKNRYTWIQIPNEYQMKTYEVSFSLIVSETTTGKSIYKVEKAVI